MTQDGGAANGTGAPPLLEAQEVSWRLGGRTVVDQVSLALHGGQWTAVVGPNGAGKSSLLSLLAGLHRPDAGEVRLLGRAMAHWPARDRARQLAWLSQRGESEGDLSVRDVVRLGRLPHHGLFGAPGPVDEAAVDAALAQTECAALADRRLGELSGGERQRVLLARALAVQAPVLLLDEPTTHLDAPHQRSLVARLARHTREGGTAAAVLHDPTLALCADRVLVLAAGRRVAEGPPSDPALQRALVEAFDGAFSIEALHKEGVTRWVALPELSR